MAEFRKVFSIAGISIVLKSEYPFQMSTPFGIFLVPQEVSEDFYEVEFKEVQKLEIIQKHPVYEQGNIKVYYLNNGKYCRAFCEEDKIKEIYAVSYYTHGCKKIEVMYTAKAPNYLKNVQQAFLYTAWEWILMQENKMMLHASCVDTPFGGILFSGPSGVGKSTQGDLWCRYTKSKLINGDKTILNRSEGKWYGNGSPYAGSSKCYVNDSCEIKALFLLKQGKVCRLRSMDVAEAFKQVYIGLTVNHWDSVYVENACNMVQQFIKEIPIYEFTCTPEEDAVRYLQQKLQEGDVILERSRE